MLVAPNSQVGFQKVLLTITFVTLTVALFPTVLPPAEVFIVYLLRGGRILSGAMSRSPAVSKQPIRQALWQ